MTTAIEFAIIVMTICFMLATMLLEFGVHVVKLGVDILGGISNDSSKVLVIQRLMTILH